MLEIMGFAWTKSHKTQGGCTEVGESGKTAPPRLALVPMEALPGEEESDFAQFLLLTVALCVEWILVHANPVTSSTGVGACWQSHGSCRGWGHVRGR